MVYMISGQRPSAPPQWYRPLRPCRSLGFCSNALGCQLARLHDADQQQLEQTSCIAITIHHTTGAGVGNIISQRHESIVKRI